MRAWNETDALMLINQDYYRTRVGERVMLVVTQEKEARRAAK